MKSIGNILFAGLVLSCGAAVAESRVVIGAYNFPPIASVTTTGKVSGLLADLVNELNTRQSDYAFVLFKTAPKRRYLDFQQGHYDTIFFESTQWSWQAVENQATPPLLMDEDVYVALKKPGRDQSFFDHLPQRRIVAMLGYHYGFANFETDEQRLRQNFDILLSHNHRRNIELLLIDRPSAAEIAIVSRSYLALHFTLNPTDQARLLISNKVDQRYALRALTRPDGPISADTLMALLNPLIQDGTYAALVKRYNLQLPDALSTKP
ncbi:transporter substrate-binding domain-containing protein [Marinobacter caseinilyticus]|uniref:transporter substrate-binding domain-containing protein n=1 Tax=Marinobacter caseinilyticus TaxID=2692195 RepID=UPI00140B2F1E|nr:transporter substrate-binding domain-containing protein [Marinobacter caseinilyticus]